MVQVVRAEQFSLRPSYMDTTGYFYLTYHPEQEYETRIISFFWLLWEIHWIRTTSKNILGKD